MTDFAWSVHDLVGIDPKVITHYLSIDLSYPSVKQKRRYVAPKRSRIIREEVDRLLKQGISEKSCTFVGSLILLWSQRRGEIGEFALITRTSTRLAQSTTIQSPRSINLSWMHISGITKSGCTQVTKRRQHSSPTKAFTVIMSCHSG